MCGGSLAPSVPLLFLVHRRVGSRCNLQRLNRWRDHSTQPPPHAPYHHPISVPSYFSPREHPPTALRKHGNCVPQLPQAILVPYSPLSPPLPPTFIITSEHTLSPGSGTSPGIAPYAISVILLLGLVPKLSAAT